MLWGAREDILAEACGARGERGDELGLDAIHPGVDESRTGPARFSSKAQTRPSEPTRTAPFPSVDWAWSTTSVAVARARRNRPVDRRLRSQPNSTLRPMAIMNGSVGAR